MVHLLCEKCHRTALLSLALALFMEALNSPASLTTRHRFTPAMTCSTTTRTLLTTRFSARSAILNSLFLNRIYFGGGQDLATSLNRNQRFRQFD